MVEEGKRLKLRKKTVTKRLVYYLFLCFLVSLSVLCLAVGGGGRGIGWGQKVDCGGE